MSAQVQTLAAKAHDAMQALRRAALAENGLHGAEAERCDFQLLWEASQNEKELADEALRIAAECASEFSALQSGHVHCYACKSSSCEHSAPAGEDQVFAGYSSTGFPVWEELFRVLLAMEDNRTDLLFDQRPELLARVVGRRRVTNEQLVSFGKNSLTYRIWGQVIAGYLRMENKRAALTVQMVETRDHKLHLQVITDDAVKDALANAPADKRSAFHRVHDALAEARAETFSLSNLWQTTEKQKIRKEVQENVFALLRHLAHSIERKGRQQQRRTVHAEVRAQQMRPVHKAYDDLKSAATSDFFTDCVRNSKIVAGKGGRIHVFSSAGRLITSINIGREELERREKRRRYVPMATLEVEEFRRLALNLHVKEDPDES